MKHRSRTATWCSDREHHSSCAKCNGAGLIVVSSSPSLLPRGSLNRGLRISLTLESLIPSLFVHLVVYLRHALENNLIQEKHKGEDLTKRELQPGWTQATPSCRIKELTVLVCCICWLAPMIISVLRMRYIQAATANMPGSANFNPHSVHVL